MGGLFKKQSQVERRLRELEEEKELVRKDIRTLSKALKNREEFAGVPRLKSSSPAVTARRSAAAAPAPGPAPAAAPEEPRPREMLDEGAAALRAKGSPVSKDSRFTNYFQVDTAQGRRPLRQEKSVQRNKAIFMLVIVLLAAYIVYRLMT
jgi:hypothetical protein